MKRRGGFTLVELLVSMALIVFIALILTEAFGVASATFRGLKAIGDMQEKLRGAATALRGDLSADHFEGRRRLSEPAEHWTFQGRPREGFFRLSAQAGFPGADEGADGDGIPSRRRTHAVLHFTVKARGNNRRDFFSTEVPAGSPLLAGRTTFFDQPAEARYQDGPSTFSSQWAEVAYFLLPNGNSAGTTPLFALYRSRFVVPPDSSKLNALNRPAAEVALYPEVSCQPDGNRLFFNSPTTLVGRSDPATGRPRRAFDPDQPIDPAQPERGQPTLLLVDVISFDVQVMRQGSGEPADFHDARFDTGDSRGNPVLALQITLRVWDVKTQRTRQTTIIQDM